MPTLPKWSEPRKAFTLALNESQAKALLAYLQYNEMEADSALANMEDKDYDDLVNQLTIITGGK